MEKNMCVNVSILLKAVASSNIAKVKKLLVSGFPTNVLCGPMYITPLQIAAANNDPNISLSLVKLLLEYGAKPDVLDRIGRSPLYHATICGHTNVVQELIKYAANPNIRLLLGNKVSIDHADETDTKCLYINTDYKVNFSTIYYYYYVSLWSCESFFRNVNNLIDLWQDTLA